MTKQETKDMLQRAVDALFEARFYDHADMDYTVIIESALDLIDYGFLHIKRIEAEVQKNSQA